MIEEIIEYISNFIIGNGDGCKLIHYGLGNSDKPITIVPSGILERIYNNEKFDLPSVPLQKIDGQIPFLFGRNEYKRTDEGIIFYQDIIASAFFLLSRCEEAFFAVQRDEYGRPVGKQSFLAKAEILDRPIVDEYGELLKSELNRLGIRISSAHRINNVYLTHDVDQPWHEYSFINSIKESVKYFVYRKRIDVRPILNSLGIYRWNSCDSFDWLFGYDSMIKQKYPNRCKDIYFLIGVQESTSITTKYWDDKKIYRIVNKIKNNGSTVGIHASFEAGIDSDLLSQEIYNVSKLSDTQITCNRNHYLISNNVEWLEVLEENGITDDYTMGYADTLGFRLGTTRAVKWINPKDCTIHDLVLHPLTAMEGTLEARKYMDLSEKEIWSAISTYVDMVCRYNGDFTFLLHNSEVDKAESDYWTRIYPNLMKYLLTKME